MPHSDIVPAELRIRPPLAPVALLPPHRNRRQDKAVGGTSLGGRLSRHRRNRISYLALLRRSSNYTMHAWYVRVDRAGDHRRAVHRQSEQRVGDRAVRRGVHRQLSAVGQRASPAARYQAALLAVQVYLRNMIKTDGVHRLSLGSYFEIPEACVLIAIPAWIATDDPLWARLIMLAAGTVVLDHVRHC